MIMREMNAVRQRVIAFLINMRELAFVTIVISVSFSYLKITL